MLPLVVFLTQTLREAVVIDSRFIPLVAIGFAILLLVGAVYLPDKLAQAVGAALVVAATASATIRYTKEGNEKRATRNPPQR